ncbi:hypothetical protein ACFFHF_12485, partial [Robertmurraya beringensis]
LPSDPPHESSRTSHCLSANTSRLNGGCIRDFHPIAKRAATRTRKLARVNLTLVGVSFYT